MRVVSRPPSLPRKTFSDVPRWSQERQDNYTVSALDYDRPSPNRIRDFRKVSARKFDHFTKTNHLVRTQLAERERKAHKIALLPHKF